MQDRRHTSHEELAVIVKVIASGRDLRRHFEVQNAPRLALLVREAAPRLLCHPDEAGCDWRVGDVERRGVVEPLRDVAACFAWKWRGGTRRWPLETVPGTRGGVCVGGRGVRPCDTLSETLSFRRQLLPG